MSETAMGVELGGSGGRVGQRPMYKFLAISQVAKL